MSKDEKKDTLWSSLSQTKEGAENILKYSSLAISLLMAFGQSWLKDWGIENPENLEFWQVVSMTLPLNLSIFLVIVLVNSFDIDNFLIMILLSAGVLLGFTWLSQTFLPHTAIDLDSALAASQQGGLSQRSLSFILAALYMYYVKYGLMNFGFSIAFGIYFAVQWEKIKKHF